MKDVPHAKIKELKNEHVHNLETLRSRAVRLPKRYRIARVLPLLRSSAVMKMKDGRSRVPVRMG